MPSLLWAICVGALLSPSSLGMVKMGWGGGVSAMRMCRFVLVAGGVYEDGGMMCGFVQWKWKTGGMRGFIPQCIDLLVCMCVHMLCAHVCVMCMCIYLGVSKSLVFIFF